MIENTQTPDLPGTDTFSAAPTPAAVDILPSPLRPALVIVALFISAEVGIMLFIMPLLDFPTWMGAVFNGLLLLLLLIPSYFYAFRPYWLSSLATATEIQKLNQQILMVAEQERERLAGELHDDAAQYLTALKLAVGALANTPMATATEDNDRNIRHLEKLVDETQERVRRVVTKLRLPDLNAGGLVQVLGELVKRCSLHFPHVQINFTNKGCHSGSYPLIDIVLYRICQEGLSNAVRHAEATQIDIVFSCQANHLKLQISDNGHGFDPAADQHTSGGIDGMRKRLTAVSGTLAIDSQPGRGSRIVAMIPKAKGGRHDSSVCCR